MKSKRILIPFMSITALILGLSVIYISQLGTIITPVSMQISSSDIDTKDRMLEFTLNRVNVGSGLTGETTNYTFSSFIDYPIIEGINLDESSTQLSTSQFNIFISTPAESFGGIIEAQEIKENILNQFNVDVLRVKDVTPGLTSLFFQDPGYEFYKDRYFYGTKAGNQCLAMYEISFCEEPHILINNNVPLRVYCAVVNPSEVKYCDEFVSNLKLIKTEVIIRPVSYYR